MSAVLDMALDDIIKSNKPASGPARRLPNRATNRAAPYATAKVPFISSIFRSFIDLFTYFSEISLRFGFWLSRT